MTNDETAAAAAAAATEESMLVLSRTSNTNNDDSVSNAANNNKKKKFNMGITEAAAAAAATLLLLLGGTTTTFLSSAGVGINMLQTSTSISTSTNINTADAEVTTSNNVDGCCEVASGSYNDNAPFPGDDCWFSLTNDDDPDGGIVAQNCWSKPFFNKDGDSEHCRPEGGLGSWILYRGPPGCGSPCTAFESHTCGTVPEVTPTNNADGCCEVASGSYNDNAPFPGENCYFNHPDKYCWSKPSFNKDGDSEECKPQGGLGSWVLAVGYNGNTLSHGCESPCTTFESHTCE